MSEVELPLSRWSPRHWLAALIIALCLWLFYSYLAFVYPDAPTMPGADFKRAYTWMVLEPERFALIAEGQTWTLNPLWQNFFMAPFVTTPWPWGYVLFLAFSLSMALLGAYWFGGQPIPLLLSATFAWVLWWGQLEGWAMLALVLGWVGMKRQLWWVMFLALALGTLKPQVSALPVLVLWWWSGRARWPAALLLALLLVFTIVVWGPWPVWYVQGVLANRFVENHAPNVRASIGIWALPLFLPALLLPLNRYQRLLALTATAQLASPYLPYYSTVLLLCFNLPWWLLGVFVVLGYLPSVLGTTIAWNGYVFLPLGILIWLYWPLLKGWWQARRAPPTASAA